MSAGQYSFEIDQGSTFTRTLTYKVSGVVVNLTGYTARMQLRPTVASDTVTLSLTTENGRISLTSQGVITLSVAADVTAALAAGVYVYDLELVAGNGTVTRLLEGSAIVSPEVTR